MSNIQGYLHVRDRATVAYNYDKTTEMVVFGLVRCHRYDKFCKSKGRQESAKRFLHKPSMLSIAEIERITKLRFTPMATNNNGYDYGRYRHISDFLQQAFETIVAE